MVDIGCNDGTLLDGYRTDGLRYLGFDPSDVGRYAVEKGYDVVRDFYSYEQLRERYPDQQGEGRHEHRDVLRPRGPERVRRRRRRRRSREDGVWVMELHYLPTMLEMNSFDAIVHEHLEYYSLAVIERLIAEAGLETVRGELNDVNGGSIRLFIAHAGRLEIAPEDERALQDLRIREFELALDSPEPYERFQESSEKVRDDLSALCRRLAAEGKTIHVYGASTKGNTILQYAGLDTSVIPYAADRNPDKWGSETIATRIPIISEEESRAMKPGLLPRAAVALPRRVPRAREGVPRRRRALHRAAA